MLIDSSPATSMVETMDFDDLIREDRIVQGNHREELRESAEQILSASIDESQEREPRLDEEIAKELSSDSFQLIGEGLARYVYSLPSSWVGSQSVEFVVKLPRRRIEDKDKFDGLVQNTREVETSREIFQEQLYGEVVQSIFCPVVDYDEQSSSPRWVVMPKGDRLNTSKGWEEKQRLEKRLMENGYYTDPSVDSTLEFDDGEYRFVDLGMGLNETDQDVDDVRWKHLDC